MAKFLKLITSKFVQSINNGQNRTVQIMFNRILDMKYKIVYKSIASCPVHRNYLSTANEKDYKNTIVNEQLNIMNDCIWTYGFVSIQNYQKALQVVNSTEHLTQSQALFLIRCCGESMLEKSAKMRYKFVEDAWNTMKHLGISVDISHFNALLQVYLSCRHNFSPFDFLTEMDKENIKPNRVTYEYLIDASCVKGDIQTVQEILKLVKENHFSVTENMYRSLIIGHALSGNMQEVRNILNIMTNEGIKKSSRTYASLICAYVINGDINSIRKTLAESRDQNIWFGSEDLTTIFCQIIISEHKEYINEILPLVSKGNILYGKKVMETIHQQLENGHDDIALRVLETILQYTDYKSGKNKTEFYHSFMRMAVYNDLPIEKILKLCENFEKNQLCNSAYSTTLNISLKLGSFDQFFMLAKAYQERSGNVREHFFYPILISHAKANNIAGIKNVFDIMLRDFKISPNKYPVCEFLAKHISADKKNLFNQIQEQYCKVDVPSDTVLYYPRALRKSLTYYCVKNRLSLEQIRKVFAENNCPIDYNVCSLFVSMYCEVHDLRNIKRWLSEFQSTQPFMNKEKILRVAITCIKRGCFQDALDSFNMTSTDMTNLKKPNQNLSEELMAAVGKTGNIELTEQIFEKLTKHDYYVHVTHKLLAPLLTVRIENESIEAALDKFESICKQFNHTPLRFTFMRQFLRDGNLDALQRVIDACKNIIFDNEQSVDLAVLLIECERGQEARKMLQKIPVPHALSTAMSRVLIFAEFYNNTGQINHLKNMVKFLRNLASPSIMEPMCRMLMINYEFANDYAEGIALWTQMQEDNIQVDSSFLNSLSRLLKKNNIRDFAFTTDTFDNTLNLREHNEEINNARTMRDFPSNVSDSTHRRNAFLYGELLVCKDNSKLDSQDDYFNIHLPDYNKIFKAQETAKATEKCDEMDLITNYLMEKSETEFCNGIDNLLRNPSIELQQQMVNDMSEEKWTQYLQENPSLIKRFEYFAVRCFEKNITYPMCILWIYLFTNRMPDESNIWSRYVKHIQRGTHYRRAINMCKLKDDLTLFHDLALKIDDANLYMNIRQKAYKELIFAILNHGDLRKYECAFECLRIALQKFPHHDFKKIIKEINDGYEQLGKPWPLLQTT